VRSYIEKPNSKKGAGGVAQGIGPEFKPQHCKKKKKCSKRRTTRMNNVIIIVTYNRNPIKWKSF
jgi:hypothetical protein